MGRGTHVHSNQYFGTWPLVRGKIFPHSSISRRLPSFPGTLLYYPGQRTESLSRLQGLGSYFLSSTEFSSSSIFWFRHLALYTVACGHATSLTSGYHLVSTSRH